jgi:hypothetical protein
LKQTKNKTPSIFLKIMISFSANASFKLKKQQVKKLAESNKPEPKTTKIQKASR